MNSKNKPCVFISYSWDSEEHKDKVKEFAEKLRSSGVDIIYDGDLKLGDRIPHFMEDGIAQSDIVLFICTPNYKYKADHRDSGVGYENNIISSELYETHNERKFIPVLFEGTWSDSLPAWAKGKLGIDLSDFSRNIAEFERLLNGLQNVEAYAVDYLGTVSERKKKKRYSKKIWAFIGGFGSLITIFVFIFGRNLPDIIKHLQKTNKSVESSDEISNKNDDSISTNSSPYDNYLLMSESSYLAEIEKNATSDSYIFYYYYTDYNGNGNCELFALVTTEDQYDVYLNDEFAEGITGDIWFVDQSGAKIIERDFRCAYVRLPFLVDNMSFIAFEQYYTTGTLTYLWGVNIDGRPFQPNLSGKGNGISINEYQEIVLVCSNYDACYMDGLYIGHTWNPYYFYWDETNFKEYGGMKISIDELYSILGAKQLLEQINTSLNSSYEYIQVKDIYYRENGIININYQCSNDSSYDDYWNYNATLRYSSDSLEIISSDYGAYNEGFYSSAFVSSIAVYPKQFTN